MLKDRQLNEWPDEPVAITPSYPAATARELNRWWQKVRNWPGIRKLPIKKSYFDVFFLNHCQTINNLRQKGKSNKSAFIEELNRPVSYELKIWKVNTWKRYVSFKKRDACIVVQLYKWFTDIKFKSFKYEFEDPYHRVFDEKKTINRQTHWWLFRIPKHCQAWRDCP